MSFRRTFVVLTAGLALICVGCGGSSKNDSDGNSAANGGAGNMPPDACQTNRNEVLEAISSAPCQTDADCTWYQAPCLQVEAGNCGGIFYTSVAVTKTIEARLADYEACIGQSCTPGGVCGLGPLPPVCLAGQCGAGTAGTSGL